MANKALAKRQKLSFRVEPSQKTLRSPVALAARLRPSGPHLGGVAVERQTQQRQPRKKAAGNDR
jgi:hypothetical protein